MWVNVGRSQFHLPSGKRRCCAAIPASSSPAARRCWSGWRRSRRSSKAPRSRSASTTIMSRRSARGATACAATSRTPRASGASRSAFPMSSSTCRSGPRKPSARFYPEIMGMPAELANGDGTIGARQGRQGPIPAIPRDRPAAAGVRRPPRADLHHGLLGPLPHAAGAQPGLAGGQPVPVPLPATSSTSTAAGICSRSSTRCAAPRIRCSCGRWSTATRHETNRTYAPGHEQWAWAMGPDEYDRPGHSAHRAKFSVMEPARPIGRSGIGRLIFDET